MNFRDRPLDVAVGADLSEVPPFLVRRLLDHRVAEGVPVVLRRRGTRTMTTRRSPSMTMRTTIARHLVLLVVEAVDSREARRGAAAAAGEEDLLRPAGPGPAHTVDRPVETRDEWYRTVIVGEDAVVLRHDPSRGRSHAASRRSVIGCRIPRPCGIRSSIRPRRRRNERPS